MTGSRLGGFHNAQIQEFGVPDLPRQELTRRLGHRINVKLGGMSPVAYRLQVACR